MESNRSSSRLKQRLVRMLKPSSLLRSSCNGSTSAATNLSSTGSSRTLLRDVHREPVFVSGDHRHQVVDDDVDGMFLARDSLGRSPSFSTANDGRHVAPVLRLSIDCGGCRPTRDIPPLMAKREKGRRGKNRKKERRVRETGGFYETGKGEGRMCPPASPSSPLKSSCYYYFFDEVEKEGKKEEDNKKQKKKKKKKKLLSNSYGFSSSSSVDSDDGFEFFTSEEREVKEETEAFFSSRSFSSDSSEFYQRPNNNKKKNKIKKPTRCPPRRRTKSHENGIASKGFQPLVSIASREKKVRELEEEEEKKRVFAVVKRSRDPYGDFRSSMVEMIMERQIFGAEDLENLLHYYLALNSPHHHPNILQAFSDIWVVLFGI